METLRSGLSKLASANESVEKMKEELSALQPQLAKKAAATETLLKQLRIDQDKADALKKIVQEEEIVCKEHAAKTEVRTSSLANHQLF